MNRLIILLGLTLLGMPTVAQIPRPQIAAKTTIVPLPVTPSMRWHPGVRSKVTTANGRVTQIRDLIGGYPANAGASGIGPKLLTDALGQSLIRFEKYQFLDVPALTGNNPQNFSYFMVGRVHRFSVSNPIFSLKGSLATYRPEVACGSGQVHEAAWLSGGRQYGYNSTSGNSASAICGSQLQVIGVVARSGAAGGRTTGQRFYINNDVNTVPGPVGHGVSGGGEIGRYAPAPGPPGSWGMFDAYEIVFYSKALTSAQGDAVAAALVAGYGIPAIAHSYLLEGDSFTQGIGQVTSGENIAMKLTEPGALLVPANWRVLNSGVSGNTVGDVTTRRDKAHSALASEAMLRGNGARNVVAINIGGNNMSPNTTAQGSLIYAAIRDLLHTKGKGYLERGWEVRSFVNAAIGGGRAIVLTQLRACLRHPSYFTDVLAGPRQTYEGKLRLIDLAKIRLSGATLFDTKTDAANNRYYQGDGTHPTVLGNNYLANGGDNRTFSYSGAL